MKDFSNGWSGLKEYALSCGVITADDTEDAAAAKIKNVIRDTLPKKETDRGVKRPNPILKAKARSDN